MQHSARSTGTPARSRQRVWRIEEQRMALIREQAPGAILQRAPKAQISRLQRAENVGLHRFNAVERPLGAYKIGKQKCRA